MYKYDFSIKGVVMGVAMYDNILKIVDCNNYDNSKTCIFL